MSRAPSHWFHVRPHRPRAAHLILLGVATATCVLVSSQVDYSPIWDGRIYADCITAAAQRFSFGALRCGGHVSHAYIALAALAEMPSPGAFPLLLLANSVLLLLASAGFHRLLGSVFESPELAIERALVTGLFTVQPALLANVVQPGIDFAMVPAFVWSAVFALQRRLGWLAAVGSALVFTKETGVLLYAILVACWVLWMALHQAAPDRSRTTLVRVALPVMIPLVLFVVYLANRAREPAQAVLWYGGTVDRSIVEQFVLPHLDLYQVNYALLVLVLSFGWILSGAIAIDAVAGLGRMAKHRPPRPLPGVHRARLILLCALAVACGVALTRFTTFGNPRYFLVARALLLVPFLAALIRLELDTVRRRAVLAASLVATLISVVRTIDPVSRLVYGTFPVGEHRLLRMTAITGECCAYGRDQLVYNLEFTSLQRVGARALAALPRGVPRTVVIPDSTSGTLSAPHWLPYAGPGEPGKPSRAFTFVEHDDVLTGRSRPDSAYFVALPNGDAPRVLRELSGQYVIDKFGTSAWRGYAVTTYRMLRRQTGP